ncbi:copper-transporting P-type ATPase [bacterium BMS3Abin05]|nr:copper-transporting P-type ATPase [bacterium BMS3Abin05]GBE28773.1 copper-transporting P-type ATPase [bacterium BMS3Bbin03]
MSTGILILGIVLIALFFLFGGSFRRRTVDTEEPALASEHNSGGGGGGCCGGNNQTHQHHHEHQDGTDGEADAWIDPVCGMPVESQNAAATKNYKGVTFYFCSEKCRAAFARNPRKYVKKEELDRKPVSSRGGHGCCG